MVSLSPVFDNAALRRHRHLRRSSLVLFWLAQVRHTKTLVSPVFPSLSLVIRDNIKQMSRDVLLSVTIQQPKYKRGPPEFIEKKK